MVSTQLSSFQKEGGEQIDSPCPLTQHQGSTLFSGYHVSIFVSMCMQYNVCMCTFTINLEYYIPFLAEVYPISAYPLAGRSVVIQRTPHLVLVEFHATPLSPSDMDNTKL